jgi:hypothetical protein
MPFKQHECDSRRQGKSGPSRNPAAEAGPHKPDGKPNLTAGRAGQELAQGHEIGISGFVKPAPSRDKLVVEISDVRDRAAETGEAQLEEDEQHLKGRAGLPALSLRRVCGCRHRTFFFLRCLP